MSPAARLALTASGFFLLSGLATGVWKYRRIMTSPEHRAPVYVDIENQLAERSFVSTWGMALLIAGEIGGVLVLFRGFVSTEVL
jgi:hypothetical protein